MCNLKSPVNFGSGATKAVDAASVYCAPVNSATSALTSWEVGVFPGRGLEWGMSGGLDVGGADPGSRVNLRGAAFFRWTGAKPFDRGLPFDELRAGACGSTGSGSAVIPRNPGHLRC